MTTRGQTGWTDPNLVMTYDRPNQQEDPRRHALTSIFWIPTVKSPKLILSVNKSDHVHYYHGGKPFEYTLYNPETQILEKQILGPDIVAGHKLQVVVPGEWWKCGRLLVEFDRIPHDYAIIGEAVGPGFDFNDFRLGVEEDFTKIVSSIEVLETLRPYFLENPHKDNKDEGKTDFDDYYDDQEKQQERTQARS